MKKRLCALVLIGAMGMALQGCGSNNEVTDSKLSKSTEAATETQETTTEEATRKTAKEETTESQQATTETASTKAAESQESTSEAEKESTTEAKNESATEAQEVDPLNMNVTKEQAYDGVNNYCHSNYDWSVAEDDPSKMYLEMGEESDEDYLVILHSYTGSIVYFNVDKRSGRVNMSEYVPALDLTDQAGSFHLFDYLN